MIDAGSITGAGPDVLGCCKPRNTFGADSVSKWGLTGKVVAHLVVLDLLLGVLVSGLKED